MTNHTTKKLHQLTTSAMIGAALVIGLGGCAPADPGLEAWERVSAQYPADADRIGFQDFKGITQEACRVVADSQTPRGAVMEVAVPVVFDYGVNPEFVGFMLGSGMKAYCPEQVERIGW